MRSFPHKNTETSVPGCDEDNFGKLAKAKSIIRDMLHKTNIHRAEEEKSVQRSQRPLLGLML